MHGYSEFLAFISAILIKVAPYFGLYLIILDCWSSDVVPTAANYY